MQRAILSIFGFVVASGIVVALEFLLVAALSSGGSQLTPRGIGWVAIPVAAGLAGAAWASTFRFRLTVLEDPVAQKRVLRFSIAVVAAWLVSVVGFVLVAQPFGYYWGETQWHTFWRWLLLPLGIFAVLAMLGLWARGSLKLETVANGADVGEQPNLNAVAAKGKGVSQISPQAVQGFRLAAERGDAGVQYRLALMYATGTGVPLDVQQAIKWYTLAAEQGDAAAQFNLALIYLEGNGVPQDYAEAVRWLRRAAEQGHTGARHNLGLMYYHGNGVPQDYVQAHMWFSLAIKQGRGGDNASWFSPATLKSRDEAARALHLLAKLMSPEQVAEARKLAVERRALL